MYSKKKIRILIADDHRLFRAGLIRLITSDEEIEVVAEAENGQELIEKYFSIHPDIIIVDIIMPFISGTKAVTEIKKTDRTLKALFLSMHDEESYIYQAIKAGGKGLLSKNIEQEELVFAIHTISDGGKYFGLHWTERKLNELVLRYDHVNNNGQLIRKVRLSERESEVLLLIAENLTSSEIAKKLELSKRTIDNHRINIMRKMGLKSLIELLSFAIRHKEKEAGINVIEN